MKTQVWVAICVYVPVAIVKRELQIDRSPYEILQILSVTLLEKTPVFEAQTVKKVQESEVPSHKELMLLDL